LLNDTPKHHTGQIRLGLGLCLQVGHRIEIRGQCLNGSGHGSRVAHWGTDKPRRSRGCEHRTVRDREIRKTCRRYFSGGQYDLGG
jgi:hypothetical protein